MKHVSIVSYSVLINGYPSSVFYPYRGLHQGDPLSPYLLMICVESLSAMTKKAELRGGIRRVKVCKQAP